jgi:hypothetical protein
MVNHTPGPLKLKEFSTGIASNALTVDHHAKVLYISKKADMVMRANARLFAAAPELLEELEELVSLLNDGTTLGIQPGSRKHKTMQNITRKAKFATVK